VRLGICKPDLTQGAYDYLNLTPNQIKRARDGKGILVYWGPYWDKPDEIEARAGFHAWVDAHSGTVLGARDSVGGGFGRRSAKRFPFAWGLPESTVCIYKESATRVVKNAAVQFVSSPKELENGSPVTLKIERLVLLCRFLPKSGLLLAERDGIKSFGKPNAPLLKALREMTCSNGK
jgi:hypothetical protein